MMCNVKCRRICILLIPMIPKCFCGLFELEIRTVNVKNANVIKLNACKMYKI